MNQSLEDLYPQDTLVLDFGLEHDESKFFQTLILGKIDRPNFGISI